MLASADGYTERGVASWYGPDFQGHNTSSGEPYDMYAMTAAHRTLPLPCYARVTNLANGRSVIVRINDRGPFIANRIVDLSYTAALRLDVVRTGPRSWNFDHCSPKMPAPAVPIPAAPVPAAPTRAGGGYALVACISGRCFAGPGAQRLVDVARPDPRHARQHGDGPLLRRVRVGPVTSVEDFDRLAASGEPRLLRRGSPATDRCRYTASAAPAAAFIAAEGAG